MNTMPLWLIGIGFISFLASFTFDNPTVDGSMSPGQAMFGLLGFGCLVVGAILMLVMLFV